MMGATCAQRVPRSAQCLSRIAAVLACISTATAANAQYRIEASGCGPQADLVSTLELELTRLGGAGSADSGSSYTECNSGISAVSGEMFASTGVSFETGSIGLMPAVTIASFRDQLWVDGLGPGQTALISATFAAAGNAEIAGGSGSTSWSRFRTTSSARPRSATTCRYGPRCAPRQLRSRRRAVALAQIGGTLSLAGSGDGAQRFTYPEVLSVPEPGSVATVAAALTALALRHRLGRQGAGPDLRVLED